MEDYRKYLDPEVISNFGNILLKAKLVVEGFITGLHQSPYHGFNAEFAEYRQYIPGDDIKFIDWKVFAKTNRYYIKEFEEETNLKSYLLLDKSASMAFKGNGKVSKFEYSVHILAALAYLMMQQQDSVGLLAYDTEISKFIPPRMNPQHLYETLKVINSIEVSNKTSGGKIFHQLAEKINRRGLIIIFSDFLDNLDELIVGLKHFRHQKHEVILFRIMTDEEFNFPYKKDSIFIDMETKEEILTYPWKVKEYYLNKLKENTEKIKKICYELQIDFNSVSTSQPFDYVLLSYLNKRKKIF